MDSRLKITPSLLGWIGVGGSRGVSVGGVRDYRKLRSRAGLAMRILSRTVALGTQVATLLKIVPSLLRWIGVGGSRGVSVGGGRKLPEVLTAGRVGDEDFVVTARIGGSGG